MENKDIICEGCKLEMEGFSEDESFKIMLKKRNNLMKKHGFIIDIVMPDENELFFNFHTHGLLKSRKCSELQLLFPYTGSMKTTKEDGMGIIWNVVRRIDKGEVFKDGDIVENILAEGYKVKLFKVTLESGEYLRILLPDDKGFLPDEDKCDKNYKTQLII